MFSVVQQNNYYWIVNKYNGKYCYCHRDYNYVLNVCNYWNRQWQAQQAKQQQQMNNPNQGMLNNNQLFNPNAMGGMQNNMGNNFQNNSKKSQKQQMEESIKQRLGIQEANNKENTQTIENHDEPWALAGSLDKKTVMSFTEDEIKNFLNKLSNINDL